MKSLIYIVFGLFLVSCKTEKSEKIKTPIIEKEISWNGIYTNGRIYKDTIREFNYVLEVDSSRIIFLNKNRRECLGEIISENNDVLTLKFKEDHKNEIIELHRNSSEIVLKGDLIRDNNDIEDNSKNKNYCFSNDKYVKVYKSGSDHMYVDSKNGLVLRSSPSLKSEKKFVIPNKTDVSVITSTNNYDYLTLSGGRKVLGAWKRVITKDDNQQYITGYVFDAFLSDSFGAYSMPYDRSSEDPERKYIDIYNEEQFFQNLDKGMTTLNIKAKKLNLIKYLEENGEYIYSNYDYRVSCFVEENENGENELIFKEYFDFEIRSDVGTEIITYPIVVREGKGVVFNNLKFKMSDLKLNKSSNIHFVNIHFNNQPIIVENGYWLVSFKNCSFSGYSSPVLTTYESNIEVENCKFFGNTTTKLINVKKGFDSDVFYPDLRFNNSYVVKNKNLKKIIDEGFRTGMFQNVIEY